MSIEYQNNTNIAVSTPDTLTGPLFLRDGFTIVIEKLFCILPFLK